MNSASHHRVRRLDPAVANQIAAGEVVERPLNACKELLENALDAGARRIVIDIEDGGKKLIRVRDDGYGMSAEDAVLALQRHATSKLRTTEDLSSVRTLGFRGEALPSIAAVSRLELTTREANAEAGSRLMIEAGVVADVLEVGCQTGTDISVRNLFYNTPARYKFLKSDAAEAARIAEMVGQMALAYPQVSFQLRHNGNEVLYSEAAGDAFNAIVSVFGRDTARQMLPIAPLDDADGTGIRAGGFAGRPQMTRANRNAQIFFVNGRAVKNRVLQHAVAAAYEGLVHGHGRYPVAVVFIEMPTAAVDVNVHPTKSEVRFAKESEVHHAVRIALRETLIAAQLTPDWGLGGLAAPTGTASIEIDSARTPTDSPDGALGDLPANSTITTSAPAWSSRAPLGNGQPYVPPDYRGLHRSMSPRGGGMEGFRAASHALFGGQSTLPDLGHEQEAARLELRPLAQISHNAYILCEAVDALYIVCQHRAHERILADRALAATEGKPVDSQHLVIPFTVEAGPRAAAAAEEHASLLRDLGFEFESFGGTSILVRAVPALVANDAYETVFTDILDELLSGGGAKTLQEKRRQLLTMMACKNAIKAGDPLNQEQMRGLIDDLMQMENPSICPHGQPILIKISTLELDKKFEREYASR